MNRLGIDVGGTNTDAVLVEDGRVVCSIKTPTTQDITSGIAEAIRKLTQPLGPGLAVQGVMVGTTHFINAVVERKHLSKVAAIRIGLPATRALPPFSDWPRDLRGLVRGGVWMLEGGHDYDGRRFMPLDLFKVREVAREIRASGITHVAVTALFSPLDPGDEQVVAAVIQEECPEASVTCSHSIGGIGLLERENATILNASLISLARRVVHGFEAAKARMGIAAPLFITQNDGTIAEAQAATEFPVFSISSGPTNSMRGAAYLSKLQDALVIDVGGTTSDFGFLRAGFPREANSIVKMGDVRTLFRMPDLISIGLGGGSVVDAQKLTIGPASVGYRLTEEAMVFGGNTLTATDIGVAAGLIDVGDRSRVRSLQTSVISGVLEVAREMIEDNLDRMKPDAGDATLIAVGGGAFLVPEGLQGVREIVRPQHGDCANAVGSAIAQVSGEVDQIFQNLSRSEAIALAREMAENRAVKMGAAREALSLVEASDMPIAYLPGNSIRVRVKVVGDASAAAP